MMMQEARDLSLQLGRVLQVADGSRVLEKLLLDLLGEHVPSHDHRGPEAGEDSIVFRARDIIDSMGIGHDSLREIIRWSCHRFNMVLNGRNAMVLAKYIYF
jgi:hypothetical protein